MVSHLLRRLAVPLKLLVGGLLFAIVLRRVDFSAMRGIAFHPLWLGPAFSVALLIIVVKATRWQSLLSGFFQHEIPFKRSLAVLFVGQLFAFVTPSRAGDIIRANYVKEALGLKKGALSVAMENLMDLLMLLAFSTVAAYFFRKEFASILSAMQLALPFHLSPLSFALAGLILGVVAAGVVWLQFSQKIRDLVEALSMFVKKRAGTTSPVQIFYWMLLTLVSWLMAALVSYLSARALGQQPPLAPYILLLMLQSVLQLLPVTVMGLGLREGTAYLLYPIVGIAASLSLPVAWIATFFLSVVPALIGTLSYALTRESVPGHNRTSPRRSRQE